MNGLIPVGMLNLLQELQLSTTVLSTALYSFALFCPFANGATLQGYVRDTHGIIVTGATIQIEFTADNTQTREIEPVQSDPGGRFYFSHLHAGSYTVRARKSSFRETSLGPISIHDNETRELDLVLKPLSSDAAFFDEPNFTVAGVTDHSYVGGHGSDTVVRSAEALTEATASLSPAESSTPVSSGKTETALRAVIQQEPNNFQANNELGRLLCKTGRYEESLKYLKVASKIRPEAADLHHLIASNEERLGKPLESVREYQRAAELDPSEANLFDWGVELLIHQAPGPAGEVFNRGIKRFPRSSRMLLGAAVALYVHGDYTKAALRFFEATDLNPSDPQPYLFLGNLKASQITSSPEFSARMARFAKLHPQNPRALYDYAMSLWTQRKDPNDEATFEQAHSLLEQAVKVDPKFAAAYLQLGILAAEKHNYLPAITSYLKAIEIDPAIETAHYRLAQAYRQTGEVEKAESENHLFQRLSENTAQKLARERGELQRFVVTLKSPGSED